MVLNTSLAQPRSGMRPSAIALVTLVLLLCSLILVQAQNSTGNWHEVKKTKFPLSFFAANQGVGSDGEYWYFSENNWLWKVSTEMKIVKEAFGAIPPAMKKAGWDHIGAINVYQGLIYAPVEHINYVTPALLTYNASTLVFTGTNITVPQAHFPWIAADPTSNLFYSSEFDNVTTLYVYDAAFKTNKTLTLSGSELPLMAVQGGCVNPEDKHLYLTSSAPAQPTTIIDVTTGTIIGQFDTNTNTETEGCVFWDRRADGLGILHFLNGLGHPFEHAFFHWDNQGNSSSSSSSSSSSAGIRRAQLRGETRVRVAK